MCLLFEYHHLLIDNETSLSVLFEFPSVLLRDQWFLIDNEYVLLAGLVIFVHLMQLDEDILPVPSLQLVMLPHLIVPASHLLELMLESLIFKSGFEGVDEFVLDRVLYVNSLSGSLLLVPFDLVELFSEVPVLLVDLVLHVLKLTDGVLESTPQLKYPFILLSDLGLYLKTLVTLLLNPELKDFDLSLDLVLKVSLLSQTLGLQVLQPVLPLFLGFI